MPPSEMYKYIASQLEFHLKQEALRTRVHLISEVLGNRNKLPTNRNKLPSYRKRTNYDLLLLLILKCWTSSFESSHLNVPIPASRDLVNSAAVTVKSSSKIKHDERYSDIIAMNQLTLIQYGRAASRPHSECALAHRPN